MKVAAIVAAVTLAGCRSGREVTSTPTPVTDTTVTDTPRTTPQPTRTYTVMNFTAEVEGVSVSGQLRIAQDSAMWMSVQKFIEVGRGLATTDSLFLRSAFLGHDDAIDYPALRRRIGRKVTFADLQQAALADDAEERIARLANQLGINATIRITRRQQVSHLSMPYDKPSKP